MAKWVERVDHKGRLHRFPYFESVGVPAGFKLVTDPEPVTDAPIQPVAEQTHPVAEFHQHPTTTRETSPGEDIVGVKDEIDIKMTLGKKFRVKGWPQ